MFSRLGAVLFTFIILGGLTACQANWEGVTLNVSGTTDGPPSGSAIGYLTGGGTQELNGWMRRRCWDGLYNEFTGAAGQVLEGCSVYVDEYSGDSLVSLMLVVTRADNWWHAGTPIPIVSLDDLRDAANGGTGPGGAYIDVVYDPNIQDGKSPRWLGSTITEGRTITLASAGIMDGEELTIVADIIDLVPGLKQ